MSVINRVEIASLLNKHGDVSSPWEAKMRHLILNLKGQSTAMNMENGFGKTTLSDALIGMLSRERSLMRKTRRKMSPSRDGKPWTHVRVEFSYSSGHIGQSDILAAAGEATGGSEQWVFGMYGHADTDPHFYYYQGRLEQLPVHSLTADRKLQLFSNDHFQHSLRKLKPEKPKDRESWLEAIKEHISRRELEQLASFQKEGGADKSQIFNAIKPRPGEKADQAFFYEVLAPQILAGASQGETDESEEYIEDLVINSGRNVSELKHRINEKTADLQRNQNKKARLDEMHLSASQLTEAISIRNQARHQLESQALCLNAISQKGLPGIPVTSDDQQNPAKIASELAIRPGEIEPLIPLSVLAQQTGSSSRKVEEFLESRQLSGQRHDRSDIVYHPDASWCRGKPMRLYPSGKAIELLGDSHQLFKDDAERVHKIEELQEAVDAFLDLDTNPFRDSYLADREFLKTLKVEVTEFREQRIQLDAEREELETRDKEFIDNETVYKDAIREALFTEQELNSPDSTEKNVRERFQAIEQNHNNFLRDEGRFSPMVDSWSTFVQQNGNALTPEQLITEKDQQLENLNLQLQEHTELRDSRQTKERQLIQELQQIERQLPHIESERQHLTRLFDSYQQAVLLFPNEKLQGLTTQLDQQLRLQREQQSQLTSEQYKLQSQLDNFEKLSFSYQKFITLFSDEQPEGLENLLGTEKSDCERRLHQLDSQFRELEVLVADLKQFQQQFPDTDSRAWLSHAQSQYPLLLTRQSSLVSAVSNNQRQLKDLATHPVSPGSTDLEVEEKLNGAGIDYQPLHSVITELLSENDSRREEWLGQAHNLLFAPVLASETLANKASKLFAGHRIPVPVFTVESLKNAVNNGQGSLLGAVIGYQSMAVKSLLDPRFVENLVQQLQEELDTYQQQLVDVNNKLSFFNPLSDSFKLATRATVAVEENAERTLAETRENLNANQDRLVAINQKLSDENRQLIRSAEQYLFQGGKIEHDVAAEQLEINSDRLLRVEQTIDQLTDNLSETHRKLLSQAEEYLAAGGNNQLKERQEESERLVVTREQLSEKLQQCLVELDSFNQLVQQNRLQIDAVYNSGEKERLHQLDNFLKDGGPHFMAGADKARSSLKQQLNQARQRANLKFDRIKAYLNARDQKDDAAKLKNRIASIKQQIKSIEQSRDGCESNITRIQDNQPEQLQAIHQIDETACRWLKQLIYFAPEMLASLPAKDEDLLDSMALYEKAEAYIQACTENADSSETVRQKAMELSEQLEQENIRELGRELKRQENRYSEKRDLFSGTLERIKTSERHLFNSSEWSRLSGLLQNDDRALDELVSIIKTTEEQIVRHSQTLEQLEDTMSGYHERLYERISSIIIHAVANLRILRNVVSSSKDDNAYFTIDADTVDEEGVNQLVRSLFAEVESFQQQIRNRQSKNLTVGSEEKQVKDLQDNLRKQIYRRLFTNVRIRLKHNAIRQHGRLFSLNEDMSEGQREAVSLMWLVKLSEFAIERELKSLPSQYRRRERKSSESVIILDGLFSKLSHKKLIEDSLESLRNTRGRFQMIGLIHNPNYENDPGIFPTYLVGNVIGGLQGQGGHVTVKDGVKVPPSNVGRSEGEASLFHLHVEHETA